MAILFCDGVIETLSCGIKEYLSNQLDLNNKQHNFEYYTTMRMLGRNGIIPELEMHLDRIKADSSEERSRIKGTLKELNKKYPVDLRVTLLRFKSGIEILAEEMPVAEIDKSCQVEIRKGHRKNVTEKSAQWIKDRKALEEVMAEESNEVILCDEEGNLYEGLSSNFFVLRLDGKIQTAPLDSVLTGTVMKKLLLETESKADVVFEFARVEEIDSWLGAFITSTSRLVLPIHRILIPEESDGDDGSGGGMIIKEFVVDERLKALRKKFIKDLEEE